MMMPMLLVMLIPMLILMAMRMTFDYCASDIRVQQRSSKQIVFTGKQS